MQKLFASYFTVAAGLSSFIVCEVYVAIKHKNLTKRFYSLSKNYYILIIIRNVYLS